MQPYDVVTAVDMVGARVPLLKGDFAVEGLNGDIFAQGGLPFIDKGDHGGVEFVLNGKHGADPAAFGGSMQGSAEVDRPRTGAGRAGC